MAIVLDTLTMKYKLIEQELGWEFGRSDLDRKNFDIFEAIK